MISVGNVSKRVFFLSLGGCEKLICFDFADEMICAVQNAWLDKISGKICLSISSNGLAITGIDDRRYWSRIPTEESR